ncbi:MAG: Flp pilus assembly protein CpaB [Actinomycetia bacterium]|jgi:Flp pilus assembly protein CpaB|nr:Flp pilus assembly protein CpaB [Actinomycetes bacterium]
MLFRRKLPRSSFILLSASVASALAAALVMRAYAHRLDVARPDGGPPIAVVAAVAHVPRGSVLTETALEVVTLPARFAPPGAIRDLGRATGRIAVADIAAGEVVTQLRLAGSHSGPTASLVGAGMRAVEIPVASAVGVRPGDLVDVIATFGGGGAHTEVASEAIEVLAVDRAGGGAAFGGATAPPQGATGLVLLVSPTDAEALAFASAFATLSVAVRGPDDLVPGSAFTVPVTADR